MSYVYVFVRMHTFIFLMYYFAFRISYIVFHMYYFVFLICHLLFRNQYVCVINYYFVCSMSYLLFMVFCGRQQTVIFHIPLWYMVAFSLLTCNVLCFNVCFVFIIYYLLFCIWYFLFLVFLLSSF